jgi:hypothetical protein
MTQSILFTNRLLIRWDPGQAAVYRANVLIEGQSIQDVMVMKEGGVVKDLLFRS